MISSGVYGYPKAQALQVAIDTITRFLLEHDMTVYIVVFSKEAFEISSKLFNDITAYIDDVYVDKHLHSPRESTRVRLQSKYLKEAKAYARKDTAEYCSTPVLADLNPCANLDEMLNQVDESFAEMLLRKIDEKNISDAECYKKANIDRRLFNKIKNSPSYKPSKQTVLAFAISLELTLEQTKEMLEKAGFALSHSNKSDIIVEYFILTKNFNVIAINQVLFKMDLQPLGY